MGTTRYATTAIATALPMARTRGGLFDVASAATLIATWDAASRRRTTIAASISARMPRGFGERVATTVGKRLSRNRHDNGTYLVDLHVSVGRVALDSLH